MKNGRVVSAIKLLPDGRQRVWRRNLAKIHRNLARKHENGCSAVRYDIDNGDAKLIRDSANYPPYRRVLDYAEFIFGSFGLVGSPSFSRPLGKLPLEALSLLFRRPAHVEGGSLFS